MYGISNSQQQGGGGGCSAASYKAIKSSIAPSDWQEVEIGEKPFFVGENAMEWAPNEDYGGMRIKSSPSALGLQLGIDYTATIDVDGVTYTQTAQIYDPSEMGGMKVLIFGFSESIFMYIYDGVAGIMPGVGDAFCAVPGDLTATSFIITKFEGAGFGTSMQATIADSAIEVNSAVTMYINTSEKIAVGEKTNGNVTLIAPSIPTEDIPYSLEIVGTDSEGLFELVNGYVLDISDIPTVEIPTSLPQKTSGTKSATWRKGESSTQINDSDITETSDIVVQVSCNKEIVGNIATGAFILRFYDYPSPDEDISLTYKVKQTDGRGQLVIVNSYVPSVPSTFVESVNGKSGVVTLSKIKTITNASTNVSITGTASPYLFKVSDDDVRTSNFIRLYPADEVTEDWLNENTLSSIITEKRREFTFKVSTNTLPASFSMKYIIESPQ